MKNLTLTERDLEQFADTGRHSLALFVGQYALIRPKFPTVTDGAVEAMITSVKADPQGTPKRPGIDAAVYFAAIYTMGARNLEANIAALTGHPDPVPVLHAAFGLVTACANSINALTLLSRGGLMPELHLEERAPIVMATRNAKKRHAKTNEAKAWVQEAWKRDFAEYQSKADFARIHAELVKNKFAVTVRPETIVDNWLNLP